MFKDLQEEDPAKRYKMLFMCSDSYKVCAAFSEDGVHWKRYKAGAPVISQFPDGHFADSHMVAYWDPELSRYVAILRQRTRSGKSRHKTPAQSESRDFVNWTPPRPLLRPEEADGRYRQFYNMEVMLYEGIRLGFTTVFAHGSREDQPFDRGSIQLTYSREGRRWERWKGRVFLPVSEQPGDFDWGMVYMAQAPVVVGDEIYLYYAGHGHDHRHHLPPGARQLKGGVGLAKLRLDGFVAVEPTVPEEQGSLTTKSFRMWGEKLQINASAPEGPLTVEILDGASRPIPGFSRQDCDPFSGDRVRHTVTWQGQAGLRALKGKTVRLKFYLVRARLYAFQVSVATGMEGGQQEKGTVGAGWEMASQSRFPTVQECPDSGETPSACSPGARSRRLSQRVFPLQELAQHQPLQLGRGWGLEIAAGQPAHRHRGQAGEGGRTIGRPHASRPGPGSGSPRPAQLARRPDWTFWNSIPSRKIPSSRPRKVPDRLIISW